MAGAGLSGAKEAPEFRAVALQPRPLDYASSRFDPVLGRAADKDLPAASDWVERTRATEARERKQI